MSQIPEAILSDALREAIDGRRVKVAVFLTYQFDPGFFEHDVLPVLFSQEPYSQDRTLRRHQVEGRLREAGTKVCVYYDREGLLGAEPARLDYQRIGLTRAGCFHAKNILLLVQNMKKPDEGETLLLVTVSANLTESGWWRNVEAADIQSVAAGEKTSLRDDLFDLLRRIREEDNTAYDHPALDEIHYFVQYRSKQAMLRRKWSRWQPHLYTGKETIPDFLADYIERDNYNLEIISPYFDATEAATTLEKLIDTTEPREVRVFLPRGKDGAALCKEGYFDAVQKLARVKWAELPRSLVQASANDQRDEAERFVHAKAYRFWNREREILFLGSPNLTQPAHSKGSAGNFETGILVEPSRDGAPRLEWWMTPIGGDRPVKFAAAPSQDERDDVQVVPLSLRFDWSTGELAYFWERPASAMPVRAQVSEHGCELFVIDSVKFETWVALLPETAGRVQQVLASTSVLEVSVDGATAFPLLVREENMVQKPSHELNLSVEQILHYWSLTPDKRDGFLPDGDSSRDIHSEYGAMSFQSEHVGSMFDQFHGIFHAFNMLKQKVLSALSEQRDVSATCWLLGKQYDSLPVLLDKVIGDTQGDAVNRYITLLCARQVIMQVQQKHPDWMHAHRIEVKALETQLQATEAAKVLIHCADDPPGERARFFDWFEDKFLEPAQVQGGES